MGKSSCLEPCKCVGQRRLWNVRKKGIILWKETIVPWRKLAMCSGNMFEKLFRTLFFLDITWNSLRQGLCFVFFIKLSWFLLEPWTFLGTLNFSLCSHDDKIKAIEAKLKLMNNSGENKTRPVVFHGKHPLLAQSKQKKQTRRKKRQKLRCPYPNSKNASWSLLNFKANKPVFN